MFNILLFFLCVQIKLFHCHCHCHYYATNLQLTAITQYLFNTIIYAAMVTMKSYINNRCKAYRKSTDSLTVNI